MKLCKKDLFVNIFKCTEGIFDIYCQSKDMADFHNLERKTETRHLNINSSLEPGHCHMQFLELFRWVESVSMEIIIPKIVYFLVLYSSRFKVLGPKFLNPSCTKGGGGLG